MGLGGWNHTEINRTCQIIKKSPNIIDYHPMKCGLIASENKYFIGNRNGEILHSQEREN
jgi:hypothetical protein